MPADREYPLQTRVHLIGNPNGLDVDETLAVVEEQYRNCMPLAPMRLHRDGSQVLVNPSAVSFIYEFERTPF